MTTHRFHARRRLLGGAGAGLGALAVSPVRAAGAPYPSGPVRLIVPFPPGGPSDQLARLYGKALAERLGQPFVIENRPGGATNIGASLVAHAPPDGHTLLVTTIASNVLNRWTYRNLNFDPAALRPIGFFGINTLYLMVAADAPYRTVRDLVDDAKRRPQGLAYGSFGRGGPNHLIAEVFRRAAGIENLTHVPYKGSVEASVDLMAGRIDFMIDGATINLVDSGKLRALAVAFDRRWPTQPAVPTMAEAGYPGVTITTYFALTAPPRTPDAILDGLNAAMRAVAAQPDVEARMPGLNLLSHPVSRAETEAFMERQASTWGPLLASMDIRLD